MARKKKKDQTVRVRTGEGIWVHGSQIVVEYRVGRDWAIVGQIKTDGEDFDDALPKLVSEAEHRAATVNSWT